MAVLDNTSGSAWMVVGSGAKIVVSVISERNLAYLKSKFPLVHTAIFVNGVTLQLSSWCCGGRGNTVQGNLFRGRKGTRSLLKFIRIARRVRVVET